jgi:signal transduction histidine kinase
MLQTVLVVQLASLGRFLYVHTGKRLTAADFLCVLGDLSGENTPTAVLVLYNQNSSSGYSPAITQAMSDASSQPDQISVADTAARIASPLFLISLALLVVTGIAAWSMQQSKNQAADLVLMSLQRADAIRELETTVHQMRSNLYSYMRTGDEQHLNAALGLQEQTERWLVQTERLLVQHDGRTYVAGLRRSYTRLTDRLNDLSNEDKAREAASNLLDGRVADALIEEAQLQRAEQIRAMTAAVTQHELLTQRATWAMLGLGVCGAIAGLGLGVLISRRVRQSLLRLEVPVRDAAGQLSQVVGPIAVSGGSEVQSLQERLDQVASQVGTVVERLQASEHERLRTEQLSAVGQLAAGLAHELRNPLTAMKTLIQSARYCPGQSLDERDLEILDTETTRLNDGIQLFLDFARPPKLEKREFELHSLIDNTTQLVTARAKFQGADLHTEVPSRPIRLVADFEQLRQVLVNLLFNAFEAMPDGGRVVVTAKTDAEQGDVIITVSDTGAGLRPDVAHRLFDPFVSSKDSGTGLGLSISRRIIEDHGGSITVRSEARHGTVFEVRLPVSGNDVIRKEDPEIT